MRATILPARLRRCGRLGSLVLVLVSGTPAASQHLMAQSVATRSIPTAELGAVRAALEKYADPIAAVHDGYFSTLACIEYPAAGGDGQVAYPAGGMGVHFLNPALIGPARDPARPQVLIYEPKGEKLQLVAAEWFVPLAVGVQQPPQLFGRSFDGPMEGHHPVMPASMHHYDLHVWLWKANPAGMFSPTNPDVRCPRTGYTFAEKAPRAVSPK